MTIRPTHKEKDNKEYSTTEWKWTAKSASELIDCAVDDKRDRMMRRRKSIQ